MPWIIIDLIYLYPVSDTDHEGYRIRPWTDISGLNNVDFFYQKTGDTVGGVVFNLDYLFKNA